MTARAGLRVGCFPILLFCVFSSGCATENLQLKQQMTELNTQLVAVALKFDLAKRENLNLKRELALFKKNNDVDSRWFLRALSVFETDFSDEVSSGGVAAELTDRGMVVMVLSDRLFVSASDALSDAGKEFLDRITRFISDQFRAHYIYVEGHTDNQSLAVFEWKSDWDFSFARALSVVKYFTEKKALDPLRFSASGFGQYRPRSTNDTKEGRRLNRRIQIIISPQKLEAALFPARPN